jgi:hypothetical protein
MIITHNSQTVVCFSYFYAGNNLSAFLCLHFCLSFQFLILFAVPHFFFSFPILFSDHGWPTTPEANIRGGGKVVHVVLKYLSRSLPEWGGAGGVTPLPLANHPVS